jgi:radical SAM-linked protein
MARADVPFLYSQGYSPHPKISFGPPLTLGWESETEMMEIELAGKNDWKDLSKRINENLPEGLMLSEVISVAKKGLLNKEIKYISYSLGLPKDLNEKLIEEKLSIKFAGKRIEIYKDEGRSGNDLTKNYFVLKVEESVKMKDVLNEISESSGRFYIFVKRLAFYDKDGNRI